uniref:UBA domain-containing protein n=1 Tax=Lactuca sativa TaxID=4236 RepID=A0A9R1XS10_LACSA|nr:hypothetical protein LSAT_V11C300114070 [Lactuca sativa]
MTILTLHFKKQISQYSSVLHAQAIKNPTQTGASPGSQNNMGFDMLMSMFGGLGAGGMGVPNVPDVAPEQLYATQLSQLQEMGFFDLQENIRVLCATSGKEMGFFDLQENIRVLCATSGNVYAAVERLLGKLWSMMVMMWHFFVLFKDDLLACNVSWFFL